MQTVRAAAALLAAARSAEHLAPLLRALGFTEPPLALDADGRAALGLPVGTRGAHVFSGPGALRALALDLPADGVPLREHVSRLAGRVAARSPHVLWLVAAVDAAGAQVALAAWSGDRAPPRVAALVVERARVVDSDAETLAALAAAAPSTDVVDVLVHARWLELLGRDALGRRFYRALERVVHTLADSATGRGEPAERHDVALLYVSRLLFLAFLEAKGWLGGDRAFLVHGYEACIASGGGYHRRVLLPLFFGTLNTPIAHRAPAARALGDVPFLNGGLFARAPVERRCRALRFPDPALGAVFGELLSRYRFTAREDGHGWSEAAVDPEMLGRAFESLMAARERRTSGAFYTPQPLVDRLATRALGEALADAAAPGLAAAALRGEPVDATSAAALRDRLAGIRLLDPACGSGAFLVHALEQLAALAARLGDERPIAEVRRGLLTRCIFGVDVNPTAVWLCELRLWLSVVIESVESNPGQVHPLPNLDHHVRVGDALAGGGFTAGADPRGARALARLRARYVRASGTRKRTLARALERAERTAAVAALDHRISALVHERRELLGVARAHDLFGHRRGPDRATADRLTALRASLAAARRERRALAAGGALPFAFDAHFADVGVEGGFGVVIGNPPWVRLHNIARATRPRLRAEYGVFRDAAWQLGAAGARAGRGFAAQVDLAALFVERGLRLLAPGGTLAFLLPAKLWRSLAGGGVRRLLAADARLTVLEDLSEAPATFDAAVYPSLLVARRAAPPDPRSPGTRRPPTAPPCAEIVLHRPRGPFRWSMPPSKLPLADPASPWLLLPRAVRRAFDLLTARGTTLGASTLGRPLLGVKCGYNDAFVVAVEPAADARARDPRSLVAVRGAGREGQVEARCLRPLVRGECVLPWHVAPSATRLVWTHDEHGDALAMLPPGVARWLEPMRGRLQRRTDLRRGMPWWTLFRTEASLHDRARVVWPDIGRTPRAAVLPPGDPSVPLNSCYAIACPTLADAHTLAALLNSPVGAAWGGAGGEPDRGGCHRYLAWTAALLPVPRDWARARAALAPIGARAAAGRPPDVEQLTSAVLDAYGVPRAMVAPLLAWTER